MKKYDVTIRAYITKTVRVEAENEDDAIDLAHQDFNYLPEKGVPEDYDEETMNVEEVK